MSLAEPLGLSQGRQHHLGVGGGHPVHDVLQDGAQGRDGRPQLVRDIRHQLLAVPVHGLQIVGHPIDRGGQVTQLVLAVRAAHPAGVVAVRDALGDGVHLVERGGQAVGDELGDQQGGDHREDGDEAQLGLRAHGHHQQAGGDEDGDDDKGAELGLDGEGPDPGPVRAAGPEEAGLPVAFVSAMVAFVPAVSFLAVAAPRPGHGAGVSSA